MTIIIWFIMATVIGVNIIVAPCTVHAFDICKNAWVTILTCIMVIIWAINVVSDGRFKGFNKTIAVNKALVLYIVAVGVSVIFSDNQLTNIIGGYKRQEGWLFLVISIAFFIIVANFITKENIDIFVNTLIVLCVVCIAYGFVQEYGYGLFGHDKQGLLAPYSTFGNPIFFAMFLSMIMPLFWYKLLTSNTYLLRILYLFGIALIVVSMINTQCRSGLLTIMIASIIYFFVAIKAIGFKRLLPIIIGIVMIVLCISGYIITKDDHLSAIASKFSRVSMDSDRVFILKEMSHVIKNNFVTGIGNEGIHKFVPIRVITIDRAHNEIVQQIVSYGILGLIAYLYLIYCFCHGARRVYRLEVNPKAKLLIISLFIACASYFMCAQFNPTHISITTTFYGIAGSIYGIKNYS